MKRVLCNATVSPERDGEDEYEVTVTGVGHQDGIVRTYKIEKSTQKDAAMEGIRLFTDEVAK